jgi:aspartyl-tRNA(Asn)/glutamyl-tRNA(Gln) amidotransferase subunit C
MDSAQVRRIALLARIDVEEHELGRIAEELSVIVRYFDKLAELDTTGVEPLVHAVENRNVLAADVPGASLDIVAALSNAPAHDGSLFRVPRVLGEGA